MKTKVFFLVIIISILSTMSLSAQVTNIYLDTIPNNTRLYYCDVDSVVIHTIPSSGEFILTGMGSVVFTDRIAISQQTQGAISWGNITTFKQIYINILSPEECEKMK